MPFLQVDPELAQCLVPFVTILRQKEAIENDAGRSALERVRAISELRVDGARLEDLCIEYSIPGEPEVPLWHGEGETPLVSVDTVGSYVRAVLTETLHTAAEVPANAFFLGFSTLCNPRCLTLFTPAELKEELCGAASVPVEQWSVPMVQAAIRCDHGYTKASRAVGLLTEVICSFSAVQRRHFLQFATGSSRLPPGGLGALRPPLTVVLKHTPEGNSPDAYLPSASTCTNYLKLPDYSCEAVLRRQLEYAVQEGRNAFLLS